MTTEFFISSSIGLISPRIKKRKLKDTMRIPTFHKWNDKFVPFKKERDKLGRIIYEQMIPSTTTGTKTKCLTERAHRKHHEP